MVNQSLQSICRGYLLRLRPLAEKFGLGGFIDETIRLNTQEKCSGTEEEVMLLSRACDDERLSRAEVPKLLGKSYRQTYESGDFDKVKTLRRVGIYSKLSALLLKSEIDNENKGNEEIQQGN